MGKEYRNSIRSRRSIRTAYAELINEKKDASKITVKEIVDRADISKSTFYCHYNDINDLELEIQNDVLRNAKECLDEFINNPESGLEVYLKKALDVIKKNENDYKLIASGIYPTSFLNQYKEYVIETLMNTPKFKTKNQEPAKRYAEIAFFACGYIDLICGYLQGYSKLSLDENVELAASFINDYLNK
jgi:AcrR family transcriptional regulator